MKTPSPYTPEQKELAMQIKLVNGSIEEQRWKQAEIAYAAAETNVPAWAEIVSVASRRSPSTVYEWRRAVELRKSVNYRYPLSISFYVSAANALSVTGDTYEVEKWLETCANDKTITLESARVHLPWRKPEPVEDTPFNLADWLSGEYIRIHLAIAEAKTRYDKAALNRIADEVDRAMARVPVAV